MNDDKLPIPCKWLRKNRECENPWYCASPAIKSRMKLKDTDYCLGCSVYEPKEQVSMIKCTYCNSEYSCFHDATYRCICLFKNDWDIAEKRCKYYKHSDEAKLREILAKIYEYDLEFIEKMLEDNPEWTMKQISLSLNGRYDP